MATKLVNPADMDTWCCHVLPACAHSCVRCTRACVHVHVPECLDIQCCLPSVRRWCVYLGFVGYGCASIGSPIIKQDAKCLCLKGSSFCDLGQLCFLLIVMASLSFSHNMV